MEYCRSVNMKDLAIAIIILFILTAFFSYRDQSENQDVTESEVGFLGGEEITVPGYGDFLIQSSEEKSPLTGYF